MEGRGGAGEDLDSLSAGDLGVHTVVLECGCTAAALKSVDLLVSPREYPEGT